MVNVDDMANLYEMAEPSPKYFTESEDRLAVWADGIG